MNKMIYFLVAVALIIGLFFFMNTRNKKNDIRSKIHRQASNKIVTDTTLDSPIGFGYKCMWIAVKTTDQEKIADLLGFDKSQKTNWKNGIENAYNNSLFITPPIDEWTLIVGYGFPREDNGHGLSKIKDLLARLSSKFGEAQYFASHRVVEYHCWIKSIDGKSVRAYGYVGESGENIEVFGEETTIEQTYKLGNTLSAEAQQDEKYYAREDLTYPDEEMVMEVAESWSINPTTLDERIDVKGLGIVGKLN